MSRFVNLPQWLSRVLGAKSVSIKEMYKMSGGAIQENWAVSLDIAGGEHDGSQEWVLRTDSASVISTSHGRPEEFALLNFVYKANITVPRPIVLCEKEEVLGQPFFLMKKAFGTAMPRKILGDPNLSTFGPVLARRLGEELSKLHSTKPSDDTLRFLPIPDDSPALARIYTYRADLDALPHGHPVLEYALNWLEDNAPENTKLVLCHSDYRTGNYMVDNGQLTAILDWEFASWSDPEEDIGWFTARCWRFGNSALPAGGIAHLEDFLKGYEASKLNTVNRDRLRYWQVMAETRWAVIALQQGERCRSGEEISQELALSGLMTPEMELNILNLIEGYVQ